jgi:hypothetical protein
MLFFYVFHRLMALCSFLPKNEAGTYSNKYPVKFDYIYYPRPKQNLEKVLLSWVKISGFSLWVSRDCDTIHIHTHTRYAIRLDRDSDSARGGNREKLQK